MSVHYLAAVWRARIVPPGAKLVAATLADRADDNGTGIRFAMATIAKRCSMSQRQVQRHRGELVRGGILSIERQAAQHAPTVYRMSLERLEELARDDPCITPEGEPGETSASPLDEARGDIEGAQGCHPRSPGVTPASPKTTERRPKDVSREGDAAASAVPATAGALPAGIDALVWGRLFEARTDLSPADIAEQAEFHRTEGCPAEALNRALDGLRLNRGHRSLSPNYKRARPTGKPKPPATGKPVVAKASAPAVQRPGASVVRMVPKMHPLQAEYRRIRHGGNTKAFEKERLDARLRAEFPQHLAGLKARPGEMPWLAVDSETHSRIKALLADEWLQISGRLRDKRRAFHARHAGGAA